MSANEESVDARVMRLERELATMTTKHGLQAARADALTRELVCSETAAADAEALRIALAVAEARADFSDEGRTQLENLERELMATRATLSWRTTQPLRIVRRRFPNGSQ